MKFLVLAAIILPCILGQRTAQDKVYCYPKKFSAVVFEVGKLFPALMTVDFYKNKTILSPSGGDISAVYTEMNKGIRAIQFANETCIMERFTPVDNSCIPDFAFFAGSAFIGPLNTGLFTLGFDFPSTSGFNTSVMIDEEGIPILSHSMIDGEPVTRMYTNVTMIGDTSAVDNFFIDDCMEIPVIG